MMFIDTIAKIPYVLFRIAFLKSFPSLSIIIKLWLHRNDPHFVGNAESMKTKLDKEIRKLPAYIGAYA